MVISTLYHLSTVRGIVVQIENKRVKMRVFSLRYVECVWNNHVNHSVKRLRLIQLSFE